MTIVTFDYYMHGESGSDTYRLPSRKAALEKFAVLKRQIEAELPLQLDGIELVDEPDFYGFRDESTGSFLRVYLSE